jgi:dynein heavy chain
VYTIKQESNDYYNVKMINFNSMSKAGIKNYFTLSARGVTKYENSAPVEFKPLEEWIKERNEFNEIKELSFFQKFRKWKSMKKWLKILSQERFKKVSEVLSERLFILNPDYRSILIAHNSMCYDIEHFKLVELPNDSLNIVDFKQEQFKRRN